MDNPNQHSGADIKALEALGRFADYSDEDLARQCRFQARSETLDPDYEKFMRAVALRLDALASAIAERDEARAAIAEADKHAEKIEALLDPHVSWEGQPSAFDVMKSRAEAAEARLEELTRERDEARQAETAIRRNQDDLLKRLDARGKELLLERALRERTAARLEEAKAVLGGLLDHVDRNTCTHETTHRGGSIWTICDDCGKEWADDRGGFVPYVDPEPVAAARAFLHQGGSE